MFGTQQNLFPQTTAAPSLFGGGQKTGFSFGGAAPTQTAAPTFGTAAVAPVFGAQPQATTLFGQPATSAAAPSLFGTTSTAGASFGTQQQPQQPGGFFAQTASIPNAGSFFSTQQTNQPTANMLSFQNTQQMQPNTASAQVNFETVKNFTAALTAPQIFGDERDAIIARFNQLQAFCGVGKGFFSGNANPVDFTFENPFCRLKTICYNRLGGLKDEDGLVALIIKKSESDVKSNLQLIIDLLFKLTGARPTMSVNVETTKALAEDKCEITIFLTETGPSGVKRRISATNTYNFFKQPNVAQQLTQQLLLEQLALKVDLTPEKVQEYLAVPPAGFDVVLWNQAVIDNPNPAQMLPHVVSGFGGLRERQKLQAVETRTHDAVLKDLTRRIEDVELKLVSSQSRLIQMRSNENLLSHRLLKAVGMQLVQARRGYSLEANEENLNCQLETIDARLNAQVHLKGRVAEILSSLRSRNEHFLGRNAAKVDIDDDLVLEVKQYLRKCQDAIEKLVDVVKQDSKDLNVVRETLPQAPSAV